MIILICITVITYQHCQWIKQQMGVVWLTQSAESRDMPILPAWNTWTQVIFYATMRLCMI